MIFFQHKLAIGVYIIVKFREKKYLIFFPSKKTKNGLGIIWFKHYNQVITTTFFIIIFTI